MQVDLFDYNLPQSFIAQTPASPRDSSRLLVVKRGMEDYQEALFYQLPQYLKRGDHLVLNNTRVIPARLSARRKTGAHIEVLLLKEREKDSWEALVRPSRKVKEGEVLTFSSSFKAHVGPRTDFGGRILYLDYQKDLSSHLKELGELPLPPYIRRGIEDPNHYQTIYAEKEGAVAAPTAGLHFTKRLFHSLQERGIEIHYLTLHVGLGTFRPVQVHDITEHTMHAEYYEVEEELASALNKARFKGERIIAVGTTVVRTLETVVQSDGFFKASRGFTHLFIYPGHRILSVDGMITNFHLPRSTLLMMLSAFIPREELLSAYEYAKEKNFRFYSFGDAMLLL